MKKVFVFCFMALLFASCSIDDDGPNFSFEILPVESVEIPDEFMLGETYPITVSYLRPTTCHTFKEFYYLKENNQRTVAPINYLFERDDCETLDNELVESTFNFIVTSNGSYIFKFWQGENTDGEDQFLTIEVPVVE
ncbi:hypothetical protein Q4Q34_06740 [Flavivirga abyssicola]|uniref:hypothetical protein n=1 Tax=Flavivirga abyssicola TaxID=3063533 RepID=UPI0026E03AB6|nr:hypothetical protein [Flavivirga sp. MEBiC07777]WVK14725.1 hypothetical protein Q4Q34_06740 [Flavivirga sp. MEBiC07777]